MSLKDLGRNERCHCGSGIKYKRCCLNRDVFKKSYDLFRRAYEEGINAKEIGAEMLAFHEFFPDIAEKENRTIWPSNRNPSSHEPYQLVEYYCDDQNCECNRVMVSVIDRAKPEQGTIVSVGFAFDRRDRDAGPYIDPLNPVTDEGRSIYPFIENMLKTDFEYVTRLKRHYDLVKQKVKSEKSNVALNLEN